MIATLPMYDMTALQGANDAFWAAVRDALRGPVTEDCPASALQRAPHATVFLDPDSAALL